MTSKNILLYGTLLFLLLVTTCVANFLDKHNLEIRTIEYQAVPQEEVQPVTEKDQFIQDIPIAALLPEKNTSQKETNTSFPSAKSVEKILHKEKERNNTVVFKTPTDTKAHTVVQKKVSAQRKKRVIKKKQPLKIVPSRKIVIEPVLITKTLSCSKSGKLYRWDKPFLQDIAQKAKKNRDLFVLLHSSHITPVKRSYLQHIRAYLIKKGVASNQIRIEVDTIEKSTAIVFSDKAKNNIELSLLERIQ